MACRPKPWYRKTRGAWFVTIGAVQHNLGPEKSEAVDLFYKLTGRSGSTWMAGIPGFAFGRKK